MFVSVIIPTRNRAATLQKTLQSVRQLTSLMNLEVIVVDNGSTDNTAAVCANYLPVNYPRFFYFYEPEPGLLAGRHRGAAVATGDILCFLDDDVILHPDWLSGVQDAFNNPEVHLATGPCQPAFLAPPPSWLTCFYRTSRAGTFVCTWLSVQNLGNQKKWVHPNVVWGLNFCIRKATLVKLGGFHPDNIPASLQMFQGDGETGLTLKAAQAGLKALYHPGIKLQHLVAAARLTPEYFEQRAFYQGVCLSFTALRIAHGLSTPRISGGAQVLFKLKQVLATIRNQAAVMFKPKAVRQLIKNLQQQEAAGFAYHQAAFYNNPAVRAWVLKTDYWDYRLPV